MFFFDADPDLFEQVKPYLETRIRLERRSNRDFLSSVDDLRTDNLWRFRAGVDWTVNAKWSGELQFQSAGDRFKKPAGWNRDENEGISLGYVRYREKQLEVVAGRQKINIAAERLIGSLEWSATARSIDGVRVRSGPWDLFAFEMGHTLKKPGNLRMAGATYASPYGLTQLYNKHDRPKGQPEMDHTTLAHLYSKKCGAWTFETEDALQWGESGGKDLEAWAIHLAAIYAYDPNTRVMIEANAASGGGTASKTRTFDNLLPTNHKFYGAMDLQSWRNMEEIAIQVDRKINAQLSGRASWRTLSLRDAKDAWYGAAGPANAGPNGPYVDPTGSSGRDVGREIDLEFFYSPKKNVSLAAGIGIFFPGKFVRRENGGDADRQQWTYVSAQWRF